MMILPLADALMNCLQNLTSRIAGVDNEQMTNRVIGMGAMLGFGLGAIKEQFNTPSMKSNSSETNTSNSGFKGIVSRAKSIINPSMNLSPEKDYSGNINPIRNVISKPRVNNPTTSPTPNINNKTSLEKFNYNQRSNVSKIVNTGAKITKSYLNMGVKMAEGNFNSSKYKGYSNKRDKNINSLQHTQYINNSTNNKTFNELGDNDELK